MFRSMYVAIALTLAGSNAVSEVPTHILAFPHQPEVAVFDLPSGKVSYALGCPELSARWSGVQRVQVASASEWANWLKSAPVVADLHCRAPVVKYQPAGEPGALVVPHRNGKTYIHFVDHGDFHNAVPGGVVNLLPDELRKVTEGRRGIDFHSRVAFPTPSDPPVSNTCRCLFTNVTPWEEEMDYMRGCTQLACEQHCQLKYKKKPDRDGTKCVGG